jgi:hypothetical protein
VYPQQMVTLDMAKDAVRQAIQQTAQALTGQAPDMGGQQPTPPPSGPIPQPPSMAPSMRSEPPMPESAQVDTIQADQYRQTNRPPEGPIA